MEGKFMISEKGKELMVVDNFKFRKVHESACGKVRWRCTNKKCDSKVYTVGKDKNVFESYINHNHNADDNINRQAVSNSAKRKALEDVTERPSKVCIKNSSLL